MHTEFQSTHALLKFVIQAEGLKTVNRKPKVPVIRPGKFECTPSLHPHLSVIGEKQTKKNPNTKTKPKIPQTPKHDELEQQTQF